MMLRYFNFNAKLDPYYLFYDYSPYGKHQFYTGVLSPYADIDLSIL